MSQRLLTYSELGAYYHAELDHDFPLRMGLLPLTSMCTHTPPPPRWIWSQSRPRGGVGAEWRNKLSILYKNAWWSITTVLHNDFITHFRHFVNTYFNICCLDIYIQCSYLCFRIKKNPKQIDKRNSEKNKINGIVNLCHIWTFPIKWYAHLKSIF